MMRGTKFHLAAWALTFFVLIAGRTMAQIPVHQTFTLKPKEQNSAAHVMANGARYRFAIDLGITSADDTYLYSDQWKYERASLRWILPNVGDDWVAETDAQYNYTKSYVWQTPVDNCAYTVKVRGKRWPLTGGGYGYYDPNWESDWSGNASAPTIVITDPKEGTTTQIGTSQTIPIEAQVFTDSFGPDLSGTIINWKFLDPSPQNTGNGAGFVLPGQTGVAATATTQTDASGATLIGFTVSDQPGDDYIIEATVSFGDTTTTTVVSAHSGIIRVVSPMTISLNANPTTLVANGSSVSAITATVTDANGLPVGNENLTFSATLGRLNAYSATTNSDGQATVTFTAGRQAGTAKVAASARNQSATEQINLTSADNLTLDANPTSLPADGLSTATLTATAVDSNSQPMVNQTVSLNATAGAINPNQAMTDASGQAVTTFTAAASPGTATINATLGTLSATTNIVLNPLEISLTASPNSLPADGTSTTTITANVHDITGVAVADGCAVSFSTTWGTFANGSAAYSATTTNGVATAVLTAGSTAPSGNVTITATCAGVSKTIRLYVTQTPSVSLQITAPAEGATVSGATVAITGKFVVDLTTINGTFDPQKVTVYVDGNSIGTTTTFTNTSTTEWTWNLSWFSHDSSGTNHTIKAVGEYTVHVTDPPGDENGSVEATSHFVLNNALQLTDPKVYQITPPIPPTTVSQETLVAPGGKISGSVSIKTDVTPAAGDYVDTVEFYVTPSGSQTAVKVADATSDFSTIGPDGTATYTGVWNLLAENADGTPQFPNGTYAVTAKATSGGVSQTSSPVTVVVDHTPLSVAITAPAAGKVSGNVTIEVHATPAIGEPLNRVELLIASGATINHLPMNHSPVVEVWVPDASPAGGHWETRNDPTRYIGTWVTQERDANGNRVYPDGSYTLTARATGFDNRTADSSPVAVTLSNQAGISGKVLHAVTGQPLSGALVELFAAANLNQPISQQTTGADGAYQFTPDPGQYTVRASLTGFSPLAKSVTLDAAQSLSGTDLPLSPWEVRVTSDKTSIAVGGGPGDAYQATLTATVLSKDQWGGGPNVVPGVTVTFTTDLGIFTVPNPSGSSTANVVTGADGSATTILRSQKDLGSATVTVRAGAGQTSTVIYIAPPEGTLTIDPFKLPPDGQSTATATLHTTFNGQPLSGLDVTFGFVKIWDAQGQIVYDADNNIDLRGSNNYGNLSPLQATTDAQGNAVSTYTAGTVQSTVVVRAGGSAQVITTQNAARAAARGAFVSTPPSSWEASLYLGVWSRGTTGQFTGTVKSAVGSNPAIPAATVTIIPPLTGMTGDRPTTDASGKYTSTTLTAGMSYMLIASATGFQNQMKSSVFLNSGGTTTVDFFLSPLDNYQIGLTATPRSIDADDGASASTIVAQVTKNGLNQSGEKVRFSLPANCTDCGYLCLPDGSSCGQSVDTTTNTVCLHSGPNAKTVTITASLPDRGNIQNSIQVIYNYVGQTLTCSAKPTQLAVGSNNQSTITAYLSYNNGHAVPKPTLITFTNTGDGTLTPTTATTSSGVATVYLTPPATAGGSASITASSFDGIKSNPQYPAIVYFIAAMSLSLEASPPCFVGDGTNTSTITATLTDANGNYVVGQQIMFYNNGDYGALYGWNPANGKTNSSGQVSVNFSAPSLAGQPANKSVSVSAGIISPWEVYTSLTVLRPMRIANLKATPASIPADGFSKTEITFTVQDTNGNAVGRQPVKISTADNTGGLSATDAVTGSDGAPTTRVFLTSTVSANTNLTKTVIVSLPFPTQCQPNNYIDQQTVDVTFAAAANTLKFVSVTPNPVDADGASESAITVSLTDANNHLVVGQAVNFSSNLGGSVFRESNSSNPQQCSVNTGDNGNAVVHLRSTQTGQARVDVSSQNATAINTTVQFQAPPLQLTNVSLTPPSVTSAVGTEQTFTAVYSDSNGAGNLAWVQLWVSINNSLTEGLNALYKTTDNTLWLYDPSAQAWTGGYTLGSRNTITVANGSLNCLNTTQSVNGNQMAVSFDLIPGVAMNGKTYTMYLCCADTSGIMTGYDVKGMWSINSTLANVSLTPPSVTSAVGTEQTFTAVYSDSNGAGNLAWVQLWVSINNSLTEGLNALYDCRNDQLFLYDPNTSTWKGGYATVTHNTITVANGSLNCLNTTKSVNGDQLAVSFDLIPGNAMNGKTYTMYLCCADTSGIMTGYDVMGTWTVRNPIPLQVTFEPCSLYLPYDPNPLDDDDNVVNAKKNPPLTYGIQDDSTHKPWTVTVTAFNTSNPDVAVLTKQVTITSLTDTSETSKLPRSFADLAGGTIPTSVVRGIYSFNVDVTSATNGHDCIKSQQLAVNQINVQSTATDANGKATATITFTLQGENAQTPPKPTVMVYGPDLNMVASGAATKVNQQWQATLTGDAQAYGDYIFLVHAENPAEPVTFTATRAWVSTCKPPAGKPAPGNKTISNPAPWLLADNYDEIIPIYRCDFEAVLHQLNPATGEPYYARARGAAIPQRIVEAFPKDRVFFFNGHGGAPGGQIICAQPPNGQSDYICARRRPDHYALKGTKYLEDLNLSKVLLAVYGACYSADDDDNPVSGFGNIMKQTVYQGAKAAVGFHDKGLAFARTGSVVVPSDPWPPCRKWAKLLWEALCQGKRKNPLYYGRLDGKPVGLQAALKYAMEGVKDYYGNYQYTNNARFWPNDSATANLKIVPAY